LNKIILNENIPMDQTLFSKMVPSWSNLYERNKELMKTSIDGKSTYQKEKEFMSKLAYNNDVLVNSLKITLLGTAEE